jgi:hypothetical protein
LDAWSPRWHFRFLAQVVVITSALLHSYYPINKPFGQRRQLMANDPINPAHYNGTACAEIGEVLSGNSYQVLKYNWRLGKKDNPVIEVGKSIWYLDREIKLARLGFVPMPPAPDHQFFHNRLRGVSTFVNMVGWMLISWNQFGDKECLHVLRQELIKHRSELELAGTEQHSMEI